MSHNGVTNARQMMVVISTVDNWSSLEALLKDSSGDKRLQATFSSLGSYQVCDLMVDGHLISLHYAELKEDMTEEGISQTMEGSFNSCKDGTSVFLLLIQGGHYTERERRMIEILQAHFGVEAFKYLIILSLEVGMVVEMLDDTLMDLITICNGRYCQVTSSAASDKLGALVEMVHYTLTENGVTGYTETMLTEAQKTSADDSAMKMLKEKVQEAEEKEQAFQQLVYQQEERRAKEMEELKAKHAEERRKEAAENKRYEAKRESLEEAVISHKAMLQHQISVYDDDDTKKMSVVLLGLSGSGKSSALNLILERAGNQYQINMYDHEPPQPTLSCERKEVFAAGRRLILVDTPELWDEDGVENLELVKDCLALSLPGPHVFLLVLQVGRFTQGECEMLWLLQKIFGREFTEHVIILFVRFDDNQRRSQKINDYVAGAHAALQDLIRKCGSRYYDLDVAKSQNALNYPQVKDLLSGFNKLVASHGGRSYSVKRFTVQELQDRKKMLKQRKEGVLEMNYLLRDD